MTDLCPCCGKRNCPCVMVALDTAGDQCSLHHVRGDLRIGDVVQFSTAVHFYTYNIGIVLRVNESGVDVSCNGDMYHISAAWKLLRVGRAVYMPDGTKVEE